MRDDAAPSLHKHKVAPQGKSPPVQWGRIWRQMWSIGSIDARPLLLAFAMCAGAVVYFSLGFEPGLAVVTMVFAGCLAVMALARRLTRFGFLYTLSVLLFGGALGLLAGSIRSQTVAQPVISQETGPVMLEGWLSRIEPGAKGVRLRVNVHAIANMPASQTPKYVRVTHRSRMEVAPGRFVRCWVVLRPPPSPTLQGDYDFQRQAWFEGLGGVGYVQGRCRGGALGAPKGMFSDARIGLSTFRRHLAMHVNQAAGERAGGFAAALISGDRSFMSLEDQETLRASGLAHLLAISGLHMGIVGGLVYFLTWRLLALIEPLALRIAVRKPAALVALIASFSYLVLSGASVSTQRAFIMSAVVFGAVLFDRAAISLRSFAIAMMLVVLLQPESVMTPGFQMSFAASGALIATYEAWTERRASQERVLGKFAYTWASLVVTSFVAGMATAPFALYHFDRLAPLGFLANLLAMPIVSFVSAPSAALTLLLTPFGLSDVGLRAFGYSLEMVLVTAEWCNSLAPGRFNFPKSMPVGSMALFALAIALGATARGVGRGVLASVAVIPAIWMWVTGPQLLLHWSSSGALFVQTERENGPHKFEIVDGDGLSPMRLSKAPLGEACALLPCQLMTEIGIVQISKAEVLSGVCVARSEAVLHLTIDAPPADWLRGPECAPVYGWPEVQRIGGLTLLQSETGPTQVTGSKCGARPWRTCQTRVKN